MAIFRILSWLEGISYLVILSVTMGFISRTYVFAIGMTHGFLFMLYLVFSLYASHKKGWSVMTWLMVFIAAIVPLGFVGVELFLRKDQKSS